MARNGNGAAVRKVVLSGDWSELAGLREALASEPKLELVADAAQAHEAVIHAAGAATATGAELAAVREHTTAPVVLLAQGRSQKLLDQALAAGVSDVLLLPAAVESIVFATQKACLAGAEDVPAAAAATRVFTVFSPKGGTGKSVTATNLAACLTRVERRRVLLLDLDVHFGDVAIMLGLEPARTLYDLVTAPGELDAEKLSGFTVRHASGLDVLAAPHRPEEAELVVEAKIAQLLEVAAESYDVIVVDTSPYFHGPMLGALDRTDELLLVTAPDVPAFKNVRLTLQTLRLLSFPQERIRLVLNRANPALEIGAGDLAAAVGLPVEFELPDDPCVHHAVTRGTAAVIADPAAPFSTAMRGLVRSLLAETPGARVDEPADPARQRRFRLALGGAVTRLQQKGRALA